MKERDLYVEIYSSNTKTTTVEMKRAWDADKLLASLQAQYKKEGCVVTPTDRAAYLESRK